MKRLHPIYTNVNDDVGAFFERELELVQAQTYDIKYPAFKAKTLFPVDNKGTIGNSSIVHYSFADTGEMQFIDMESKDYPLTNTYGTEERSPIRIFGGGYFYTIQEVEAAKLGTISLDVRRAQALRRSYEQLINKVAFYGAKDQGLEGFFDKAKYNPIKKASKGFSKMTPDEIVAFINSLYNNVYVNTKMVESPNCLVMDPLHLRYIKSMRLSIYSDTTIFEFIMKKCEWLEGKADNVIDVNEFVGASDYIKEAAGDDVISVYVRDDKSIQLRVPGDMTYITPQPDGFKIKVPAYGGISGLAAYYPKGIQFGTIPKETDFLMDEMDITSVKKVKNPKDEKKEKGTKDE